MAVAHTLCLKVEPDFLDDMNDAERNGFYAKLYQFVARVLGERLGGGRNASPGSSRRRAS